MNSEKRHPVWLYLILTGYFLIGTAYVTINPLWEAPDEIHHFPMVQYLQTHGLQLPSQEIGTVGLWQQEGNQPPLYYLLGAMLISPIDTSDINSVMRVNPHADIGIIRPDGNVNRLVHLPTEQFPSTGAMFATYVLRFFSLILGACTVYVTYLTGRELFPENSVFALTAAGLNAFLPMYLYISASVNNDSLSNLLSNLLLLLLMRLIQLRESPSFKTYILLGIITGAGLLSKLNIGFLIPLIALVLLIISIRLRNWQFFIFGGLISGGITIAIAGWWYTRNWILYHDPTGLNRFLEIVGRRAVPADFAQLWTERTSFIRTFWGLFGSVNVPMNEVIYTAFNWLTVLCLISATIFILKSPLLNALGSDVRHFAPSRRGLGEGAKSYAYLPIALSLLWIVITFSALVRWTSITPASQGRLVFGAISSLMVWFAVSLLWWLPATWRGWIAGLWVTGFAILAALQPFTTIAPAYAVSGEIEVTELQSVFSFDSSQIAVYDSRILTPQAHPDSYIEINVDFGALTTFDRNWSIFVHLVTKENIIIGQRDVYPARGLLATSDLQAGYLWHNPIAIYVPKTAYTPNTVEVRFGWYDYTTGQRMRLENGAETLLLGAVELIPQTISDIPNPQNINFGDHIALVGYDISTLNPMQGETLELTLYWQALTPMENDYVVFANVIDSTTLTKYAESNAMPVQWSHPTSTWETGEIIEDTHILTISENAVSGVYPIEVGLYLQQDGYPRLGVMGTYDNFIYLTPIRIGRTND